MSKIVGLDTFDVRFPTSRTHDGSDAMNRNPDYASAYVVVRTDARTASPGTGSSSRSGAATRCSSPPSARSSRSSSGATSTSCSTISGGSRASSSATATSAGSGPSAASCTWRSARCSTHAGTWRRDVPESRSGACSPSSRRVRSSSWSTSATSPTCSRRDEALALLEQRRRRAARSASRRSSATATRRTRRRRDGSVTTTLGSSSCASQAVDDGFELVKIKVGAQLEDDLRRCAIARATRR